MSGRDYERLGILDFGRQTIAARDLDPVYDTLVRTGWEERAMTRWLLAYWCFYDVGAASWLADSAGEEYWANMRTAAANDGPAPTGGRWPRAPERRHFRGDKCVKAVEWMAHHRLDLHRFRRVETPVPFREVFDAIKAWPQFGPWIAFKAVDMVDRVLGLRIDYSEADVFMYDSPREAAQMLYPDLTPAEAVARAARSLGHEFRNAPVPGLSNRAFGFPEVETILCKWKSHRSGHYPVGHDIRDLAHRIAPWCAHSPMARWFDAALAQVTP